MNTECRNIQERKHLITDVLRKCEQFLIKCWQIISFMAKYVNYSIVR